VVPNPIKPEMIREHLPSFAPAYKSSIQLI
jgi:hypothetical protein